MTIGGSIARHADALWFYCEVRGTLSKVSIPAAARTSRRKDRLWEGTCVELFFGTADSAEYWEVNLSPAGHWNVYRFTDYREGMRKESAIRSLPFRIRTGTGGLRFSLRFDTGAFLPAGAAVEVGIATVLKSTRSGTSHWALRHPAPQPDFHRREAFTIRL